MRSGTSFFCSLLIHIVFFAIILFVPTMGSSVRLDVPVYQVDLISLATPGGRQGPVIPKDAAGSPKLPEKGEAAPAEAIAPTPKLEPKVDANAVELPKEVKPEPKPEPKETKPEPKPENAVPIVTPEAKPEPKPEEKSKEKPKEQPKEKPKEKPKDEPKKKSADDILKQALEANKKNITSADKKAKNNEKTGQKGLEDALAAVTAQVERDEMTGGGEGDGEGAGVGSGIGVEATYTTIVMTIMKRNWTFPGMADRTSMRAIVRVRLAPDGSIEGATIETPSGRPDFDASVINAVERSNGQLPPPPNSGLQDLRLTFHDTDGQF